MIKKYLKSISNVSITHTGKILVVIMILTFILGYQASSLQLHVSFNDLLPDNSPRIETFHQVQEAFENDSNILLLAAGPEDSLRSFSKHIEFVLGSFDKWISGVHTQTPVKFYRKNILKLMKPDELDNFGEIFYDPNLVPFLINLNTAFENTYLHSNNGIISKRDKEDLIDFLDRLQMFIRVQEGIMLETEAADVGQKAVDAIIFGEGLKLSPDRDMLLIIIEPGFNMNISAEKLLRNMNGIMQIIDKTAIQHGIKAGLAGPLIEARNHYTAVRTGFWRILMISLAGFFFILILSFRIWSIPFMCISTLIVGLVWTLGIYSFFMKSINLISIIALIIFILLSLGNCILLISGYMEKRKKGMKIEASIQEVLQCFSSSFIISGWVVGLSFLTLIFSEIKVYQDLGIMAGISTTATMVVTIFLIPAMLMLLEKLHGNAYLLHLPIDVSYLGLGQAAELISKYRGVSLLFILLVTGFLFHQGMQMNLDTKLSNVGPYAVDTVNIEDELIKAFGISASSVSFTIDNLETARTVTDQAREIMSSGRVESISDYLPDETFKDKKFHYIRKLRRKIKSREVRKQLSSYDIHMYRKEIERLEANIIELQEYLFLKDQFKVYEKTRQLVGDGTHSSFKGILPQFINALDTSMNRVKLTYFQEQFSSAFKSTVLEMANTEPLTLHNLPLQIKDRFTGKNGNIFRINVYPAKHIWDDAIFLDRLVSELASINEKITGWPVLFVELKDRLRYYGFKAIQLACISTMILLLIGLRSIKYSLIILASIISGIIWLIGVLILLNSSLNLMNIWIIPIILAIGMNNAILIVRRWKQEKNLDTVYRSTGKAILLTMITIFITVTPFWFTNHMGLTNAVSVLLAGLGCSFLANLIILPPLLGKEIPR